jgi:alpha-glucuronidase
MSRGNRDSDPAIISTVIRDATAIKHIALLVIPCFLGCSSGGGSSGKTGGTSGASGGAVGTGGGAAGAGAGQSGGGSGSGGSGAGGPGSGGSPVGGAGGKPGTGGGAGGSAGHAGSGGVAATGGAAGSGYAKPSTPPADEDGSQLWLRYPKVSLPARLAEYQAGLTQIVQAGTSATLQAAQAELVKGLGGLTGATVPVVAQASAAGAVVIGTPASSSVIQTLAASQAAGSLGSALAGVGKEGYVVQATSIGGQAAVVVAANTDVGVLRGTFGLLRQLQCHRPLAGLMLAESPKIQRRILDHWDNLDGTIERGYAGRSLWQWSQLPGTLSQRYTDYARANASLGVNGVVLNNVNADAQILSSSYLGKVAALANVFRTYGIAVYLSAQFGAPKQIGGLSTADPLDSGVQTYWKNLANTIYQMIPDFGGFLVKANSEGQPGPADYGRTHADGANMMAAALSPHGGIVMWRAFVYKDDGTDRIGQAYNEFHPLDGKFNAGAMVQVKNGPLDFQPREPFHQLFGAMPKTPLALEVQITKEYLGEDTHLAYLGPMWQEVLQADTGAKGAGSLVARVVDGSLTGAAVTAMAGVAGIGADANWMGSHFNQANWYAFGRLAWNPDLKAQDIADEWIRQTFSNDPAVLTPVTQMMMSSRQNLVNYMEPLGLVHMMGSNNHYGPAPWVNNLSPANTNPVYFHKADATGIGFDRTSAGSNTIAQYSSTVASIFASLSTVSDDNLLFFQRRKWTDVVASSGRTVWNELVHRYSLGVDAVQTMKDQWASVQGYVDSKRFSDVTGFLQTQHYEARWWRDACLTYFMSVNKLTMPSGYSPPQQSYATYQALTGSASCPADATKPRCPTVYTGNPSPAITQ